MHYMIRGIPRVVRDALLERARSEGKSLNEAAVNALAQGVGLKGEALRRRDLSDISGTWKYNKAVNAALADQDLVDENLWR